MERKPTKEMVNDITDFVNTFSLDSEEFCKEMSNEHRTLQQSFTRLCCHWIEHCAKDDYRFDPRNEASHKVAKKLMEGFQTESYLKPSDFLPFI